MRTESLSNAIGRRTPQWLLQLCPITLMDMKKDIKRSVRESLLLLGTQPGFCYVEYSATVACRPEQQRAAKNDHFKSQRVRKRI